MARDVRMYTTRVCPYCSRAKALLRDRGVGFEEIDVTEDEELRVWLVEASGGRRTVPAIFVGDRCIGGCDELVELDRSGELAKLVGD